MLCLFLNKFIVELKFPISSPMQNLKSSTLEHYY